MIYLAAAVVRWLTWWQRVFNSYSETCTELSASWGFESFRESQNITQRHSSISFCGLI